MAVDPGTDRKTLRRRVLARFGDIVIATATSAGTTTTFTDNVTFYGEAARYAGRHALFTNGTAANLGQVRYITGYNGSTQTLTFQGALPATTAIGDEIEVTNAYGMGVTHTHVHDAINYAIAASRDYARIPAVYEPVDAYDGETARTISLPDEWVGVESIHYQDQWTDEWKPIRHAATLNHNGWSIDRPNRQITITGRWGRQVDERSIRIYGYTRPTALSSDTDTTKLDIDWLIHTATHHLMMDVVRARQGADWSGQALWYADQANAIKSRLTPNLKPSYTEI